jgi:hypothetical protein
VCKQKVHIGVRSSKNRKLNNPRCELSEVNKHEGLYTELKEVTRDMCCVCLCVSVFTSSVSVWCMLRTQIGTRPDNLQKLKASSHVQVAAAYNSCHKKAKTADYNAKKSSLLLHQRVNTDINTSTHQHINTITQKHIGTCVDGCVDVLMAALMY